MSEQPYKELVSGPATLDDFLTQRCVYTMNLVHSIENDLEKQDVLIRGDPAAILAKERSLEVAKEKFNTFENAREKLAEGDQVPALELLRDDIKQLTKAIKHNKKIGVLDVAQKQNTTLVVLQMLEADVTGKEPNYYGVKETPEKEVYSLPENVGRSEILIASLFRNAFELERYKERSSGMMYEPSANGIDFHLKRLLDYDNGLSPNELGILSLYIQEMMIDIKKFQNAYLSYRYDRSYMQSPLETMRPQEIVRFRKPSRYTEAGNALVYAEDGMLKARFSAKDEMKEKVFDLSKNPDGILTMDIGKLKKLPQSLEYKLAKIIASKEFENQFKKFEPNGKPYVVYL